MISDWILKRNIHAKLPTINNLKKALRSPTVGLGELATTAAFKKIFTIVEHSMPYLVIKVSSENGIVKVNYHNHVQHLTSSENVSTFLDVQISQEEKSESASFYYQWYKDRNTLKGEKLPTLCIAANIGMDGCEYSCQIRVDTLPDPIRTNPVNFTVSCPLDEYTGNLALIYMAQPKIPEDTWPPVSSKRYVNLAVIRQQNINYDTKFVRHTVRGDIDDILQHKEHITYENVFSYLRRGRGVLFIEGRPGCGKTTFVHKISRDWADRPIKGVLRLIFLVSLRLLNKLNKPNLNLSDILKLGMFQNLKVSKQLIEERNGEGVCFILDGLDEFSPSDEKDSLIYQLINRYYLTKSTIIVASRPAATAELRGKANKVVEIIGFRNDQIFEYFEFHPFDDISKAEKLKGYLMSHPNVLHMCYLPIHTAMVALLFKFTEKVPRTETEVYTQFTHCLILRSLSKSRRIKDIDVNNLTEEDEKSLNRICEIALEKTILNKQVLHQNEIKTSFQGAKDSDFSLGLITVDSTAGLLGIEDMYTFLHLTFQEYLAARHISTLSDEEQHKLIEEHGHMQVVWKFYCGLVSSDDNFRKVIRRMIHAAALESRTFDVQLRLGLGLSYGSDLLEVHCAYESITSSASNLLLELHENKLKFDNKYLSTSDFTAIGYVAASAVEPIRLSLSYNCNMDLEKVDALLSEAAGNCLLIHTLEFYGVNFEIVPKKTSSQYQITQIP